MQVVQIMKCLKINENAPYLLLNPISFSFLVCFDWYKEFGAPIEAIQSFLNSKFNNVMSNNFKFQVKNCFNTPIVEY